MRISDWSSDLCSSDLNHVELDSPWPHPSFVGTLSPGTLDVGDDGFSARWELPALAANTQAQYLRGIRKDGKGGTMRDDVDRISLQLIEPVDVYTQADRATKYGLLFVALTFVGFFMFELIKQLRIHPRSEEPTSELQSLMRISYAVFC